MSTLQHVINPDKQLTIPFSIARIARREHTWKGLFSFRKKKRKKETEKLENMNDWIYKPEQIILNIIIYVCIITSNRIFFSFQNVRKQTINKEVDLFWFDDGGFDLQSISIALIFTRETTEIHLSTILHTSVTRINVIRGEKWLI